MSQFRTFSFSAMVNVTEPKVTINTNIVVMLLTLFLRIRRVEVDCVKQAVTIAARTLYFIKKKTVIPFAEIQCFDYIFDEFDESQEDGEYGEFDRYSFGIYSIAIKTKDGHLYPIVKYYGTCGRSVELIDALSQHTGIPVGRRISKITDYKDLLICADCGRATKNTFKKCQYCGGQLC